MPYIETRTQEDIAETNDGLGCKGCGEPVKLGDWHASEGDVYGGCCAREIRSTGAKVARLPRRAAKVKLPNAREAMAAHRAAVMENDRVYRAMVDQMELDAENAAHAKLWAGVGLN